MGEDVLGVKEFDKNCWRAFIAEFICTFLLVFIGTATFADNRVARGIVDKAPIPRIAFAFGFTTATLLKAIVHISGGHLNPAMSISFTISGHIKFLKCLVYIVLQCVAGILASCLLFYTIPTHHDEDLGLNEFSDDIGLAAPMVVEMLLTFMVVLNAHAFSDPGRGDIKGSGPLGIGLAVVAAHMCGIEWTTCGINPARSLGPAVMTGKYKNIWVYIVAPINGAVLAALLYRFVLKVPPEE